MIRRNLLTVAVCSLMLGACSSEDTKPAETKKPVAKEKLFELVSPSITRVDFQNKIFEDDMNNIFLYEYMYNGSGVGIGDLDNDGRPDLVMAGNMTDTKVYLNKGDLQFEDISEKSGVSNRGGWVNGVNLVDINQDGNLDIYLARSYFDPPERRTNLLFINNGDGTFTESAEDLGLADNGYSIHSAFLDYDNDGDLDCYVTNHPAQWESDVYNSIKFVKNPGHQKSDHFYRNDNGKFTDITVEAGILNYGYGLGLAVGDVDKDGYPDIYVANDYDERDYYYHNNGDGTFEEMCLDQFGHMSFFSMGATFSDLNNDAFLDLTVVDMMAQDNYRQKTGMKSMDTKKFWWLVKEGYGYQYMRNVLHLNNGNGSFSDIAYMSGIAKTDWSWAPLMADFDNDGNKDLFVTNGYRRDSRNVDARKKFDKIMAKQKGILQPGQLPKLHALYPSTKLKNFFFQNNGNLTFSNKSHEFGFTEATWSNGAAYSDLDGDGDLDIVVNNLFDTAFIYRNRTEELLQNNYLTVDLQGPAHNPTGLGAKVSVTYDDKIQYQEQHTNNGYVSSLDPLLHFGLANVSTVSVAIEWPDGKTEVVKDIPTNQKVVVSYANAGSDPLPRKELPDPLFVKADLAGMGVDFTHDENYFDDFIKEILLPHKMSQFGPAICVGDVTGDGLDDFYIGGAAKQAGQLFTQTSSGKFQKQTMGDAGSEDLGATFFDADGDGDNDLYVVSGGNEFDPSDPLLQDRLYLNDGKGNFEKSTTALPEMLASGSCVVPADYDEDGDMDLFVGGRVTPGLYPTPPRNYILKNDNGTFSDVTAEIAPELVNIGMVTSASWSDQDGNGSLDLVVVGEWMPITVMHNNAGSFSTATDEPGLENTAGWWNRIVAQDMDNDGDMDYIAGNLGLNYKYRASEEEPFQIYAYDFDQSGSLDIVLATFNNGTCFPLRGRQCSSDQMPNIKDKFPTYHAFGSATLEDVYGENLDKAIHYKAMLFSSVYLENTGNGNMKVHKLPNEAQISLVNGIIPYDYNSDGVLDLLVAGNLFVSEVETGKADGGTGLLLQGDGNGGFSPVTSLYTGFFAPGDVKDIKMLTLASGQKMILVANNDSTLEAFVLNEQSKRVAIK